MNLGHEELAMAILGLDETDNSHWDLIEERLNARLNISLDQFNELVDVILPFAPTMPSPLTGEEFHVLGVREDNGIFTAKSRVLRK